MQSFTTTDFSTTRCFYIIHVCRNNGHNKISDVPMFRHVEISVHICRNISTHLSKYQYVKITARRNNGTPPPALGFVSPHTTGYHWMISADYHTLNYALGWIDAVNLHTQSFYSSFLLQVLIKKKVLSIGHTIAGLGLTSPTPHHIGLIRKITKKHYQ